MHSFLKKTLSLSLALSLLAGAASAATLTGLETETVERNWESSLFFPRMEALTAFRWRRTPFRMKRSMPQCWTQWRRATFRQTCSLRQT